MPPSFTLGTSNARRIRFSCRSRPPIIRNQKSAPSCPKAFSGLRTAEVLRLEWSDVDLVPRIHHRRGSQVKDSPAPADSDRTESRQVYSARTRTYHADIDALRTFISLPTWPNNGLRTFIRLLPSGLSSRRGRADVANGPY